MDVTRVVNSYNWALCYLSANGTKFVISPSPTAGGRAYSQREGTRTDRRLPIHCRCASDSLLALFTYLLHGAESFLRS